LQSILFQIERSGTVSAPLHQQSSASTNQSVASRHGPLLTVCVCVKFISALCFQSSMSPQIENNRGDGMMRGVFTLRRAPPTTSSQRSRISATSSNNSWGPYLPRRNNNDDSGDGVQQEQQLLLQPQQRPMEQVWRDRMAEFDRRRQQMRTINGGGRTAALTPSNRNALPRGALARAKLDAGMFVFSIFCHM
jgi:hypothetical protein